MYILLDTNVLLWSFDETSRLPQTVVDELEDPANEILFSAVSIWEIGLKFALGKPGFNNHPDRMLEMALAQGYLEFGVTARVAATVGTLPLHHHDPFDRLIVAQAVSRPARLFTSDRRLTVYSELVRQIR